jgi:hypothetical protein
MAGQTITIDETTTVVEVLEAGATLVTAQSDAVLNVLEVSAVGITPAQAADITASNEHIADATIHYTQEAIAIPVSQVTDFTTAQITGGYF